MQNKVDFYPLSFTALGKMSLELIIGPMFAGKSTTVLQRIRRAKVLDTEVFIVTSALDTRYDTGGSSLKTHDTEGVKAFGTNDLKSLLTLGEFNKAGLIVIEEAQFFAGLYDFVKLILETYNKQIIVVGLDGDSDRRPFGEILQLIPLADTVTRLTALCKRCGDGTPGLFTFHKGKAVQILIGGSGTYEALCRKHYLQLSQPIDPYWNS
jgi:thymidine kinase